MALLAIFVAMYYGTVWDGITSFIGELYQRRRRRQPGRQKSNRFITQNNNFARASRFFVHFFTVLARLRRENAQLQVFWRTYTSDDESLFVSQLNLSAVLEKSTPGKLAYTCHFQQVGINATKIEKTGIHFKTDVFAAVAVVDAKATYSLLQSAGNWIKIRPQIKSHRTFRNKTDPV